MQPAHCVRVHGGGGGGSAVAAAEAAPLAVHAWVERESRPAARTPPDSEWLLGTAGKAGTADAAPPPAAGAAPTARLLRQQKAALQDDRHTKKSRLYDVLRPPYFIVSLIVIFVCMEAWATENVRAALEYAPERRREAWRLLTYCTLHAGAQHLALNCVVALAVGWVLEREQGGARVAALWAGGVVAGALGACALQPSVHVVGASAGVYALLTAHLANVALGYGHMKLWWFRVLAVFVLAASDCAWLQLRPAARAASPAPPPVAWAAHALGAAAGAPLALLLFTGVNESRCGVVWARRACGALLAAAAVAAAVCNLYLHPDTER